MPGPLLKLLVKDKQQRSTRERERLEAVRRKKIKVAQSSLGEGYQKHKPVVQS